MLEQPCWSTCDVQVWSTGTVVDGWGEGHAGSCWWTESGEGRVLGLDWRIRAARWPTMLTDSWDTHLCEDVVEWTVLPAWSRTSGTRVWSWRSCTRCGAHGRFGGLGLKTTQRYECLVLLSLELKTRRWRFWMEPVATRGVIAEGASRWSNSVWTTWPSDQKPRSWSISPPVEWIGSM
jgi:hypothetical protein